MVQAHCNRRRLLRRGLEFHVCTINKSAHTKRLWKLIVCTSYIYIYIYVCVCVSVCVCEKVSSYFEYFKNLLYVFAIIRKPIRHYISAELPSPVALLSRQFKAIKRLCVLWDCRIHHDHTFADSSHLVKGIFLALPLISFSSVSISSFVNGVQTWRVSKDVKLIIWRTA